MKKSMKRINNNGATLVLVIVCMLFVGIIAAAVLRFTVGNRNTINTVEASSGNFYSTEAVVDDVKIYLNKISNQAAVSAYGAIAAEIGVMTEDEIDVEYKNKFAEALKNKLDGVTNGLNTKIAAITCNAFDDLGQSYEEGNSSRVSIEGGQFSIDYDAEGNASTICLNDVIVTYTDDDGYSSTIVTDFTFTSNRPAGYTIQDNGSYLPIDKYLIISGNNITGITAGEMHGTLNGNIFAKNDIVVNGTSAMSLNINSKYLLAGGNLKLTDAEFNFGQLGKDYVDLVGTASSYTPVKYQDNGNIWVNGIDLYNDANVILDNARAYVADDLSAEGDNTKFVMTATDTLEAPVQGELSDAEFDTLKKSYNNAKFPAYFGFGGLSASKDAEGNRMQEDDGLNGSAIVINGKNTDIDFSSAVNLTLEGVAYTDVPSVFGTYGDTDTLIKQGESLTFRSLQSVYMIPGECIKGVGHNPLTKSEYNAWKNVTSKFDDDKIRAYYGFDPDFSSDKYKYATVRYAESNSDERYYLYWDFKTAADAAKFFKNIYTNLATNELDEVLNQKIKMIGSSTIKIPDVGAGSTHTIGGLIEYNGTDLNYRNPSWTEDNAKECSAANLTYLNLLKVLTTVNVSEANDNAIKNILIPNVDDKGYKLATSEVNDSVTNYKDLNGYDGKVYRLHVPAAWRTAEAEYTGELTNASGTSSEPTGQYKLIIGNNIKLHAEAGTKYVVVAVDYEKDGEVTDACVTIDDNSVFNGIIISEGDVKIGTGVTMNCLGNMKVGVREIGEEHFSYEYNTEFSSLLNMFDESVFPYTDEEIEDKSLGEAAIAKRFAECGYLTDGDISDDIKSMIEGNLNAAEESYYSLPLGNSLLRKLLGLSGISGILDGDKDGKADKLTNIGTVNWKKY